MRIILDRIEERIHMADPKIINGAVSTPRKRRGNLGTVQSTSIVLLEVF